VTLPDPDLRPMPSVYWGYLFLGIAAAAALVGVALLVAVSLPWVL
jgi:hypothetical protein